MIDHENNESSDENQTNQESSINIDSLSNQKWNNPLKKTLTSAEILSQAFIFLIAGYETTATSLCFVAYNLATNLTNQDKLIDEIDQVLEKHVIYLEFIIGLKLLML